VSTKVVQDPPQSVGSADYRVYRSGQPTSRYSSSSGLCGRSSGPPPSECLSTVGVVRRAERVLPQGTRRLMASPAIILPVSDKIIELGHFGRPRRMP
jgi:hypothetical protein